MALMDDIAHFIATDLEIALRDVTQDQNIANGRSFNLVFDNSPKMGAQISGDDAIVDLHISRGWITRTSLVFCLIETLWDTMEVRPKLLVMNTGDFWDSYVFDEQLGSFNFEVIPDLKPIFLDNYIDDEHIRLIDGFVDTFNRDKGGGKAGGLLHFNLPMSLSPAVKRNIRLAFQFVVAHEISHIIRNHATYIATTTFHVLSETPDTSMSVNEYVKKAIEVDADTQAVKWLIDKQLSRLVVDIKAQILEVIQPIYVLLSTFDLSRRTLDKYQGMLSFHPVPDLRAEIIRRSITEHLSLYDQNMVDVITKCHEEAVMFALRSFQYMGIVSGAFYLLANRFLTMDEQFMGQVVPMSMLQEEMERIQVKYNDIQFDLDHRRSLPWKLIPFKMTEKEFKDRAKIEAERIFSGKPVYPNNSEELEEWLTRRLREVREEHGLMGKGDTMIAVFNSTDGEDKMITRLEWNHLAGEVKIADEHGEVPEKMRDQENASRIMRRAMAILMEAAEVQIKVK